MPGDFMPFVIFGGFASLFIIAAVVDAYLKSRITKPSDGLIGLIVAELRANDPRWNVAPQSCWGMKIVRDNLTVCYSDFMGESCGLLIDEEHIDVSPSSAAALLKVVKPILKNYAEMQKAEEEARKLCKVVKASQDILHD